MMDAGNQVLYVGKAVNLKRRVSSYFQQKNLAPRIALMVKQIDHIEISITHSEAEALILENNFIKALSPKYNILFRDDKTYPYLMFSGHDYPQISYYRGSLKKNNQYFGPFPNGYAVRESIQILQKVFQLRTCEDSVFANRQRPCLLHQIKRCSAPCTQAIDHTHYQESVAQATDFLNGKTDTLLQSLNQKMLQASEDWQFEQAAFYRDQIQALSSLQSQQYIDDNESTGKHDIDVLAVVANQGLVCVHWVSIRQGRQLGSKNFFPSQFDGNDGTPIEALQAFIAHHYLGKFKPDIILSNMPVDKVTQEAITQDGQRKIQFIHNTIGQRKIWLQMAIKNAENAINQQQQQKNNQQIRLQTLADILQMPKIERLECFDISHTQGEATIASCVVYDQEAMQPSEYRRFNIKTAKAGDDYAAMREVLTRRYGKLLSLSLAQEEEQGDNTDNSVSHQDIKWPDVVLIDGGKGQVRMTLEVWAELGIDLPIVGIAKGPERKAGLEELIIPHLNEIMQLPENNPALHLLQVVRDESHRFAITGHRAKRGKARTHSSLNDIPGIGPKRRKSLLTRFGGLREIKAASVHDIAQVEGISASMAETIYDYLHTS
jgi:excinuclease ABC subunit C